MFETRGRGKFQTQCPATCVWWQYEVGVKPWALAQVGWGLALGEPEEVGTDS